ncbi:MAG: RNA-binding protein [Oscillospiraceae bacterium]|jgi:R-binding protein (contains KH domain)|nr:MAG: RNA-binding protein [Oscillospiraceae bacterium]
MADLNKLLTDISRSIVDDPDGVTVTEISNENGTVCFELNVSENDVGKVIGRHGRIAKAIRMVMKAAASTEGKRVSVDIR